MDFTFQTFKKPINLIQPLFFYLFMAGAIAACSSSDEGELLVDDTLSDDIVNDDDVTDDPTSTTGSIEEVFGNRLSLDNPFNYANQTIPGYIREDNTRDNDIEDEIATLGRVLFYDPSLSSDNTISCASCHQQANAFGDLDPLSTGVNGTTGRHSMRLINARFADEENFFWDERAATLEEQTTMPIQDHIEMGFSGTEGDEDINDLIEKLENMQYMTELFAYAFGDAEITENRMQLALAQFVRSIQSFDSPFDQGRAQVNDDEDDFPNYSQLENMGKDLFLGRAGCNRCHRAPEFDIDDDTENNGVISVANDPDRIDTEVTRSPTLRDIFNSAGSLNGPMMHDGSFETFEEVLAHYNNIEIDPNNDNLDNRLREGRRGTEVGQNLNLDDHEVEAIVAFVKTLSGTAVYTDERWSDPFQ